MNKRRHWCNTNLDPTKFERCPIPQKAMKAKLALSHFQDQGKTLKGKTLDAFEAEGIDVFASDLQYDGRHFGGYVVSKTFEGKTSAKMQKMVWDACGKHLQTKDLKKFSGIIALTPKQFKHIQS